MARTSAPTNELPRLLPRQLRTLKKDHEKSAAAIDLRYVKDREPGIQRIKHGKTFRYRFKDKPVNDEATLARIRSLAIPPAWTDVWICKDAHGHLQATGKDVRGRKQYRYHPNWSAVRSQTKFHHTLEFGLKLPEIRERLEKDMAKQGLAKEKVLATVVSILDHAHIRVGNQEYEKQNNSYGLSTMKDKHVKPDGGSVRLVFRGKTGIVHDVKIKSRKLAKMIMRCRDLPGQELFQYLDADGTPRPIDSGMVNDYIREISGGEFTSKDFRTWKGTVHCMSVLLAEACPEAAKDRKEALNKALDEAARQLGNTRAVCRKYYVHPDILSAYECAKLHDLLKDEDQDKVQADGYSFEEKVVLKALKKAK
jgi:DNA topoisomerase-1